MIVRTTTDKSGLKIGAVRVTKLYVAGVKIADGGLNLVYTVEL